MPSSVSVSVSLSRALRGALASSSARIAPENSRSSSFGLLDSLSHVARCAAPWAHGRGQSVSRYSSEAGSRDREDKGTREANAADAKPRGQRRENDRNSNDRNRNARNSNDRNSNARNTAHARPPHQRSRKTAMSKSLQSAQERVAELLTPGGTLLMNEDTTYELIGRAEDAPKVVAGASARAAEISPRRIHPHRLFYPGAKYSPEELNPYKAKEVVMRSELTTQRGSIPKDVVADQADFRNTNFLTYFLKDSGKLVPRRKSSLPAKLHRELMREIKLARSLALMDPMSKSTASRAGDEGGRDGGRRAPPRHQHQQRETHTR